MIVISPLTDDLILVRGNIWFSVDEKFATQIRVVRNDTSSTDPDPTEVSESDSLPVTDEC